MKFSIPLLLLLTCGCAVVSANRTFPKLTWYWSTDAKAQRAENAAEKIYEMPQTNSVNQKINP